MEVLDNNTAIPVDLVRRQLTRIEAHPLFVRSARMRRFLEFTVERQITGRPHELKEYVLGIEVFDRPATHDPRLDPIVRVEARRLRGKLREYYQSEGASDELVIEYPRGSYVPQLRLRGHTGEPETPALIAVLPFAAQCQRSCVRFAEGLTREVMHELDQSSTIRVFSAQNRDCGRARIQALLAGTVRRSGLRVRVTAELVSSGNSQNLWSGQFESAPADSVTAQKQIAYATAHALSVHFGRR